MMIARTHLDGGLELISTGYAASAGLPKGVVIDLDAAAASIRKAADEAELKSEVSVDWVIVGAAGDHFQSFNSRGAIDIGGNRHEVTEEARTQVIAAAQSVPISPDREVVHVLPQEFFLDDRGGIKNPVGLFGSQLDVNIHVVTCQIALNQNLINAVNRAQMRVKKVVAQPLASAEAVLTRDEKELGTAIIDIGGGTTDIAVFLGDAVHFTKVLRWGGPTSPATWRSGCRQRSRTRSASRRMQGRCSPKGSWRKIPCWSPAWEPVPPATCRGA
jgi:cell division protein FtsA